MFLADSQHPQPEEAIRFFTAAVAIRPDSPYTHFALGVTLMNKGRTDEAIAEYREVLCLSKDFHHAHLALASVLRERGQLDEAIAECREAIRLEAGPDARHALGNVLLDRGQVDEAVVEYRGIIRIWPDHAPAHCNLGVALGRKGQMDEAITEFRVAIQLSPNFALAHNNLGTALRKKGQSDEAIAEWRAAIHWKKDYPDAHFNLGVALHDKGQVDDAIAAYREAIRLMPDFARAHYNLGLTLLEQGRFADALAALKRCHELGVRNPRLPHPSAQEIEKCERLLELDRKLPAILIGRREPADTPERIALAELCQLPSKKRYLAALRFYEQAFAAEPKLTGDQPSFLRYNAACAAALAGCGRGDGADKLDTSERARLRQKALDWLRADLAAWHKVLEGERSKAAPVVRQQMEHWLEDTDFAGVRGSDALTKLPEAEPQNWQKLWAEVDQLRQRAGDLAKKGSN
jgi:tetratricopeptide (TPR) repeat protein